MPEETYAHTLTLKYKTDLTKMIFSLSDLLLSIYKHGEERSVCVLWLLLWVEALLRPCAVASRERECWKPIQSGRKSKSWSMSGKAVFSERSVFANWRIFIVVDWGKCVTLDGWCLKGCLRIVSWTTKNRSTWRKKAWRLRSNMVICVNVRVSAKSFFSGVFWVKGGIYIHLPYSEYYD